MQQRQVKFQQSSENRITNNPELPNGDFGAADAHFFFKYNKKLNSKECSKRLKDNFNPSENERRIKNSYN
jgi:hypothetical protein